MRRIQLLLMALISCFALQAQTVTVLDPNGNGGFELGTTLAANGWTYAGHASINAWYVGGVAVTSGTRGCYVGQSVTDNNGGNGAATTNHFYRDITIPAGATNVLLSFKLRYTTAETNWDRFCVSIYPTSYTPMTGSYTTAYPYTGNLTGGPPGILSKIYQNSQVINPFSFISTATPATTLSMSGALLNLTAYAGTTFRLCFTFTNADQFGTAGNPAVDEISLTYTAPSPSVTASPSSLAFAGVTVGSSSTPQSFSLTGSFLSPASGSVTVTAPANYEVSSNGITWVSSFSISYTGATIPATPVYVRFNPTAAIAYPANVTITGGGLAATYNVPVSGTGAAACSGTPTGGSATVTPGSGLNTTPFSLSLGGFTVAGGITFQWQSGPSTTGPWTNISGATNINYSFTGITATTYYRCLVTCGASTSPSTTSVATFVPLPGCLPTSASWSSAANVTYGINTFNITGFSGSNLTDAGMTAATSTSTGYLSRLAMTPVNLQQGGTYPASTTRSSTTSYQYQTVWIDFNNNGLFENSEMVTPVAGSSPLTTTIVSPFNFNITIPLTAPSGMHLMRIRGIWESTATTIGSVPTIVHPCNLNNGSNPSYFSGNVVDYYVNIVPMPPTLYRTPTSLSFAATTAGSNSTPLTFSTNGIMLAAPPDNITVTAPANFEVSPDGTTWSSSFTIPYTTSTLPATTVHVRFNAPVTTGTYTGNVVISGGGATPVNVAVSCVSSAPCSGTPTAGTAAVSPTSASGTDVLTLSLSGFTVSGGITFQWQSGPSGTGPWTNITGATNTTHSFSGLSANTYYRCNVSCGAATAGSNTVMATFLPVPACIPTAASWASVANKTYGINTFNITGFSGSNLTDAGMTTPTSSTTGYLSRLGLAPINLQQGGVYPANTTRSTTTSRQYQCVWIDFNNNGLFEDAEAVTPVGGSSPLTAVITSPFNFNITIPLTAAPGMHLMRIRGVWESSATTIGVVPSIIHPCNINNGGNPSYFSGNVVDYYVNIVPMPPTLYRAPTSLSFAATTAGSPSTPLTFTTNGLNLTTPPRQRYCNSTYRL